MAFSKYTAASKGSPANLGFEGKLGFDADKPRNNLDAAEYERVANFLAGVRIALPPQDTIELIIDRRNKIAHEADMDPANPGFRWPVSGVIADHAVTFIEKVGRAIFKVAV